MPVSGLPNRLESILNILLAEMSVSSFKVDSKDSSTVVILRLNTPVNSERHGPHISNDTAVYRRKGVSERARDGRRAANHRAMLQRQQASSSSPSGLFLPTPPSLFYATEQAPLDVFHVNPTENGDSAADCARDTHCGNMSPCTLNDPILPSVTTQASDMSVGEGTEEDTFAETEEGVCQDSEERAQSETETEHSTASGLTVSKDKPAVSGTSVGDTSPHSRSNTSNVWQEILDVLHTNIQEMRESRAVDRGANITPGEQETPLDTS